MGIDRRQFVLGAIGGGAISALLVGCGATSTKSPKQGEEPAEVFLTFSETDGFYKELSNAMEAKQNVVIKFDGAFRVDASSKLLTKYICEAKNWEEFWRDLEKRDTEEGRKELARVFTADLLNHKALKDDSRVPTEGKLPSGEVIEPATVCLVLCILLIVGATSVAAGEIARNGKYHIEIRASMTGMIIIFKGQP